jgi:FkbH-like protein
MTAFAMMTRVVESARHRLIRRNGETAMELLERYEPETMLRKYQAIRHELLEMQNAWMDKRIAILGGSTTADICKMLELHLLAQGIRPTFYESEYGLYWDDAMFSPESLVAFAPDIVFVHTSNRNIRQYPTPGDSSESVDALLDAEVVRFIGMWEKLAADYSCPIIQNNFEYPFWRLMGNAEASRMDGRVNFITRLNLRFYEYAQAHPGFYINDINWLSADFGLEKWSAPFYWHMYKYALCLPAIPRLAQSVANIIKSIYGKNKKAFALDLDNTLWGGVVGDDGVENLEVGQVSAVGQAFSEFQGYIKAHRQLGVILNIVSKNDLTNALAGLQRPDCDLTTKDFTEICANWEPKCENLRTIAKRLALLPESFVFVDDNPAEREIINQALPSVSTPILTKPERYIQAIDRVGYFEVTTLTKDDLARASMYQDNAQRVKLESQFTDYQAYLRSLEMVAEILPFSAMYLSRVAQLTNKTNQFNLTTLRCTQEEIEAFATDSRFITLYAKLSDRFGENGLVSVVVGEIGSDTGDGFQAKTLHICIWLMSCRVLKRNLEYAMLDELVRIAKEKEILEIRGYYLPTAKNGMVADFYHKQGFEKLSEDGNGNTVWSCDISGTYQNKQDVICVNPTVC